MIHAQGLPSVLQNLALHGSGTPVVMWYAYVLPRELKWASNPGGANRSEVTCVTHTGTGARADEWLVTHDVAGWQLCDRGLQLDSSSVCKLEHTEAESCVVNNISQAQCQVPGISLSPV
jgi:hypothetical protein